MTAAAARALAAMLVAAAMAMAWAAPPTELPAMPGGDTGEAGGGDDFRSGGTVPSLPVEWQPMSCDFNLGGIGFGGVDTACTPPHHRHHHHRHHHQFDLRLRCCPVLATWLYAAQADSAIQGAAAAAAAAVAPPVSSSSSAQQVEMPVPPDDSSVCAAELEEGLSARGLDFPQINGSCDFSLCYCGIRLRQIASLECPVPYFTSSNSSSTSSSPSPAPAPAPSSPNDGATLLLPSSRSPYLRRLKSACSDPSHAGCTACIDALDNALYWGEQKKTSSSRRSSNNVRSDCRLMGLMWLLAQNSTRYAATASAVIRAVVYNQQGQCSLDEAAMPLADGATTTAELDIASSASSKSGFFPWSSPLAAASSLGLGLMILV